MADLKFEVDYSQLSRAVDELTRMGKASKNTSTAFEQAFRLVKRWQDTFAGQQGKVNAELEKTALKLKLANKSAKESAQAFLAHEKAIQDNTTALNRMRMSYDSTYAAEQKTLQLKKLLRQEIDNGNMTVRQAGAELGKYKAQLRSFNTAQMAATKASNRFGVVTQQAGYQVSDFIVQVQSGTNPFIAFSQQGSQLAGVLPLIAGRLGLTTTAAIGLSAALGIVIPLVGAIGAAWLMSGKSQDAFNGALPTLKESLKSVGEEVSSLNSELAMLKGNFDSASEAALENALSNLRAQQAKVGPRTGEFISLRDQIKDAEKALKTLRDRREEVSKLEKQEEAIKNFLKAQNDYLTDQQAKRKANGQAMQQALNLQQEVHQKTMGNTFEQRQAQEDSMRLLLDSIKVYKENEAQKKKDTEQAKRDAEALVELTLKVSNIPVYKPADALSVALEKSNSFLLDGINKAMELKEKLGEDVYEVLRLAGVDVSKPIKEAELSAAKLAVHLGTSYENALKLQNMAFSPFAITTTMSAEDAAMAGSPLAAQGLSKGQIAKAIEDANKKRGGKQTTIEDTIKQLQRQADKEKKLVVLTGQRRREEELFIDLKNANADADIKTSETRLRSIAQEISAMEERNRVIEEAARKQEEIADTIAGSMGDAFMSIVDGTKSVKDAFRDMARDIIKRLYEILVVEQMVQSIAGVIRGAMAGPVQGPMLPSANGNIFSKGSLVPFANGGIVGSPMYFPMSGGRTGLMGEAGPEAIMPLKRGKNGKLGVAADGGTGNVTINQTFAFQANGDESVKKIIAQQAPKIAQMTQQQIMDSRRRGGQMKAVFG